MQRNHLFLLTTVALMVSSPALHAAGNAQASISIDVSAPGKPMSQDLIGVFFEDISFGADGGLYAEMVQNRSFDFSGVDRGGWNSLTYWSLVQRGGGAASIATETANPLNANNQSYLALTITNPGDGVGVSNEGFFGMSVKQGDKYNFSFYAKRTTDFKTPFEVRLESKDGSTLYAQAKIGRISDKWKKYTATLTSKGTDKDARLVILTNGSGTVYMDMVSLFPQKTFKNRQNGLRADLAQLIADIKPKFMRFPGGCVVHGRSIEGAYRWKDTVGPVEQRKGKFGAWGYHQSFGLGYYEFFQYCEDIGAKPLPVLPAGTSCQWGSGSYAPMDELESWVQDALDLIEYANGPVTSKWGAVRAAAGHPKPFNLEYLGVGNEEGNIEGNPMGDRFKERFPLFVKAIRDAYPNIKIIGTIGPSITDPDHLHELNAKLGIDVEDEHYYMPLDWFLNNNARYDNYNRTGAKIFAGEYASKGNALMNAVGEASYLTGLERNSDVVILSCYAPMLCNVNNVNWKEANLIWFDNTTSYGTPSYYVQKLFGTNQGSVYLPSTCNYTPATEGANGLPNLPVAVSASKDNKSGDLILKLVNPTKYATDARVSLRNAGIINPVADLTVLTGNSDAANSIESPNSVTPTTSTINVGRSFKYTLPAWSVNVIRVKKG